MAIGDVAIAEPVVDHFVITWLHTQKCPPNIIEISVENACSDLAVWFAFAILESKHSQLAVAFRAMET